LWSKPVIKEYCPLLSVKSLFKDVESEDEIGGEDDELTKQFHRKMNEND